MVFSLIDFSIRAFLYKPPLSFETFLKVFLKIRIKIFLIML
ncbi:hypothetical protein HPSA_03190 [Helicobacter pylori SouthAfrica7]|uniref:Uncharacterized protein n=1 Tax=Helicobacter pylori (strain SouthAfrica7) TaxID=907239 RepID=E8QW18_HELPW|nr:hypothetical protein HPSA_03190 [Helicobacter pylori SouthAfrica7]